MYGHVCGDNWQDENKNNLRTIEAQIVQNLKNNEARPKFTGSYKKERVMFVIATSIIIVVHVQLSLKSF